MSGNFLKPENRSIAMNYGKTRLVLCEDDRQLGKKAAEDVATVMRDLLGRQDRVKMVFAGAKSQQTFLSHLATEKEIDWSRVFAFNMDEFYEPSMSEEFTVCHQTRIDLYDLVHPAKCFGPNVAAAAPYDEANRYDVLLREQAPIDILCQGIGVSGHLAFNDPPECRFDDARWVRVINICEDSKRQIMDDPNFNGFGRCPEQAITMTIPALMSAHHRFTMVPYEEKRPILTRLLATEKPTEKLPASILREYEGNLYIDRESCPTELLNQMDQLQ